MANTNTDTNNGVGNFATTRVASVSSEIKFANVLALSLQATIFKVIHTSNYTYRLVAIIH